MGIVPSVARATKKKRKEQEITKKSLLLSDPDVKRWYDNLLSRSANTAETGSTKLSRFSELVEMTPAAIAKLEQSKLEDLVQDTVRKLESSINPKSGLPYAPDYIKKLVDVLKSWLHHCGREIKRDIAIKDSGVPVTLERREEHAPEPEEIDDILLISNPRCRTSISFMCYGGVRPGVLGDRYGQAGLQLNDLPDFEIESLSFRQIPAQVIVRREVSKIRHQYFTFLNRKGCEYLIAYLKQRRLKGEILTPESPVICANPKHKERSLRAIGREATNYFLTTENITNEIRETFRSAGKNWRPYVDRVYFASHTTTARLDGKIDGDIQKFWMGHSGETLRQYTLNKHRLPKVTMEKAVQHYVSASRYLTGEKETKEERIESSLEYRELKEKIVAFGTALTVLLRRVVQNGDMELKGLSEEERGALARVAFSKEIDARKIFEGSG